MDAEKASLTAHIIKLQELASADQSPAGDAFVIEFGTEQNAPVELELVTELAPLNPELAQSAKIVDGEWVATSGNFYHVADSSIRWFINGDGTYQATIRTLKANTGDVVELGRKVYLTPTFDNKEYF